MDENEEITQLKERVKNLEEGLDQLTTASLEMGLLLQSQSEDGEKVLKTLEALERRTREMALLHNILQLQTLPEVSEFPSVMYPFIESMLNLLFAISGKKISPKEAGLRFREIEEEMKVAFTEDGIPFPSLLLFFPGKTKGR